jgi:hypothetical protein
VDEKEAGGGRRQPAQRWPEGKHCRRQSRTKPSRGEHVLGEEEEKERGPEDLFKNLRKFKDLLVN